jgi:hypothetical protein
VVLSRRLTITQSVASDNVEFDQIPRDVATGMLMFGYHAKMKN